MLRIVRLFLPLILIFLFNIPAFALSEISENVRVDYEQKNSVFAKYVLSISQKVRESVTEKTGIKYDNPILIKISPSRSEFNKITGINNLGIQGIAISEANLTVINSENVFNKSNDDIFRLLEHEFAHIYMGNYISHGADISFPRWLNEGVAQWVSGGANELFSSSFQDSLQTAFISNRLLPFSAIIQGFPNTQDNFTLAYAQSLSMIEYLVEKHGNEKLENLLVNLKQEKNFYTAFSKTYSQTFQEVEGQWHLDKRKSNYTYDYYFSTHIDLLINGLIVVAALLAFIFNFFRNRKIKKQYQLLDDQD